MSAGSRAQNAKRRRRATLAARVSSEFGIDVRSVDPVAGGYDSHARVWRGAGADGRSWSIKESVRDTRFGLALAAGLGEAGVIGVSAPRRSRTGEPWSVRDGVFLSVAPWVDGVDAVADEAEPMRWHEFGATLRAVHESPSPPTVRPARRGIRRGVQSPAALLAGVDARVRETARPAADAEDTVVHALGLWREHRDRFVALAELERRLKRERVHSRRVPLHGDPHTGNVIVAPDGRPWLIDFDEATTAPREVDLMLIELGVIFSRPVTDTQRAAFRSGYGADAVIDESRIVRFGCVRAVEDLAATMHQLLDGPADRRSGDLRILQGLLGGDGLAALVERRIAGERPAGSSPTPPRAVHESREGTP
ncbi:spectinomycin phosphotransferase [Diaminobutyricimonas aerilata]|uniref:Spectinomycin phosphotransferase n=1 Tax=Diaminobutyricimonas aerilata TaxID=1162967 RepID=A0A2M9CGA9_9MICO|nr:aminoglycoside phosphotransferase family protein [Diaminobutyricimonas aerilata]PJJ70953.1 spectinomycin phosphotransferase [Diaminobutyricimonas aerilata]